MLLNSVIGAIEPEDGTIEPAFFGPGERNQEAAHSPAHQHQRLSAGGRERDTISDREQADRRCRSEYAPHRAEPTGSHRTAAQQSFLERHAVLLPHRDTRAAQHSSHHLDDNIDVEHGQHGSAWYSRDDVVQAAIPCAHPAASLAKAQATHRTTHSSNLRIVRILSTTAFNLTT